MWSDSNQRRRVGYWWSEKKSRKHNPQEDQSKEICRSYGLEFVKLQVDKPLEEQGPFVAIVHSLAKNMKGSSFLEEFEEYIKRHPEVIIIDPLPNVTKLLYRYDQYKLVSEKFQKEGGAFVPTFVEFTSKNIYENISRMKAAGVGFPCVCKPAISQGTTLAHEMCIIFNEEGLNDITPPCVAQQFVNHSAVLYKLSAIGDKYIVDKRPSLKNFSAGSRKTIFFYSHSISKLNCASELTLLDESEPRTPVIPPEKERLDHIVKVIYNLLELALVGIDVIIDNETGEYAIIDVNMFPGYDGVDNFFHLLCDYINSRTDTRSKPLRQVNDASTEEEDSSVEESFDSALPSPNKRCTDVLPYNCFCCPITGACSNSLPSIDKVNLENSLNLSAELSSILHAIHGKHAEEVAFPQGRAQACSHSPDSTQDDSGVETSDSCDEKKKARVLRSMKRQHSKHCTVPIALEGIE